MIKTQYTEQGSANDRRSAQARRNTQTMTGSVAGVGEIHHIETQYADDDYVKSDVTTNAEPRHIRNSKAMIEYTTWRVLRKLKRCKISSMTQYRDLGDAKNKGLLMYKRNIKP